MIYTLIFALICIIALISGERKPGKFVMALLFVLFVFFVGFRGDDVDNDYWMYVKSITLKNFSLIQEPTFKWISGFWYYNFGSTVLTFVTYALLGIWLKLKGMKDYSNYFWLSFVIYFSTFFILQEMNAIRAGVASGFMLLAIKPWKENDKYKTLLLIIAAIFFHFSFAVLIPLVFLVKNKEDKILWYIMLIPLAYFIYFTVNVQSLLATFNVTYVVEKNSAYDDADNETKVLSTVFIIKMIFITLMYLYRKKLAFYNNGFFLFYKLYCIGLFMVIILAKLPAAGMRFLDIFIIVELFLLPIFVKLFAPQLRWIPKLIIIAYSSFYLYLYMEAAQYVRDYYFIFDK